MPNLYMNEFNSLIRYIKANITKITRVFGNCHSTLIGTVVDWWLSVDDHIVLEGAPELTGTSEAFRSAAGQLTNTTGMKIRSHAVCRRGILPYNIWSSLSKQ